MIIYKTTNLINGKIYVGKDSKNDSKYLGSGKLLKKAIKKYGRPNFRKDILQHLDSKEELNEAEVFWINELRSRDKTIGYNISIGGDGQRHGSKLSDDTKRKISKSQTLSGYIEKFGIDEGIIRYNKRKERQSRAQIERFKDINEIEKIVKRGKDNGMYGRKHSQETINLIKYKNIGRKHKQETIELYKRTRSGKNNGMYGRGNLISGKNNGRSKLWKLIDPNGAEYLIDGPIHEFLKENNLNPMLFKTHTNGKIPLTLKIRGINKSDYQSKINSLGWSIFEC